MGRTKKHDGAIGDNANGDIEAMSCGYIDTKPVDFDWTVRADENDERLFEWAEMVECPKCGRQVAAVCGEIEEHGIHPVCEGSHEYSDSAEGPMMSYYYEVAFPGTMAEAAALLPGPVCAVTLTDGTEALALTGGGMDLSWEICDAYLALGCLPPLHFARDLPMMAGMKLTERTDRVLRGALRSAQVASRWASEAADKVRRMRAELVAEAGKTTPKKRARARGGRK